MPLLERRYQVIASRRSNESTTPTDYTQLSRVADQRLATNDAIGNDGCDTAGENKGRVTTLSNCSCQYSKC